jgi:SH3-like domain-containing protein
MRIPSLPLAGHDYRDSLANPLTQPHERVKRSRAEVIAMRKMFDVMAALTLLVSGLVPGNAVAQKKAPYWVSISAGKAMMRTGPGREFPARWQYQRAGLPLRVIETYPNWRKVEDPDGETGWMQGNLLGEDRTALVVGGVREMRARADPAATIVWRAEPGVVGKISQCARGWCLFDVKGRSGYISVAHIWGVDADEKLP